MEILKRLGRGLLSSLLKFALVTLAIAWSLWSVFGTAGPLKRALRGSGVYDTVVSTVIEESQKQPQNDADIPLARPEVRSSIDKAFSPVFLQTSTENVIDGIYGWLNQKTAEPQFQIDLSGPKQTLSTELGNYVVNRAKGLPVCTLQQLREQGYSVDPFNATCRPPGFDVERLRAEVNKTVNTSDGPLKNTLITQDSLAKDDSGEKPFQKAAQVPKVFGLVHVLLYGLGGLAIIAAGLLILLHDERRRGLRSVGVTLVGTGFFMLVFSGLLSYLFAQANRPTGSIGKAINNGSQKAILSLVSNLSSQLGTRLMLVGGIYIVIGGIIWFIVRRITPPKPVSENLDAANTITTDNKPDALSSDYMNHLESKDNKPKKTVNRF